MSAGLMDEAHSPSNALAPVLGDRWAFSWASVAVTGWFALLFLLISHTPLSLNGTWRAAYAGSWITTHGELPGSMPGVPLAEGMPYHPESWLFDTLVAEIARLADVHGLSTSTAVLTSMSLLLWCGLFYQVSRSIGFLLLSAVILGLAWSAEFGTLQPRMLTSGLLAVILWLVLPARPFGQFVHERDTPVETTTLAWWRWLSVATLFLLWGSLDDSFFLGLLLLLAISLGTLIRSVRNSGARGIIAEPIGQWAWLLQLSAAATFFGPQGLAGWNFAVTDGLDELLRGASNGLGLYLPSASGVAVCLLLGLIVFCWTRCGRGLPEVETTVLLAMMFVAALDASTVFWFVPVALLVASRAWFVGSRLGVAHSRVGQLKAESRTKGADANSSEQDFDSRRPLKFAASLVCVLLIWCAFALSPVSNPLLGGAIRPASRILAADIPREVTPTLRNLPANQLVWAPSDWAEWFLWDGPPGLQVFANSQLRLLPQQVRADYRQVFRGASDWDRVLDRYAVGVLIVDKSRQPRLVSEVMRNGKWKLVQETSNSLTLQRVDIRQGGAS